MRGWGGRLEKGGHECFCNVHEHEVMRREWNCCWRQNWSGVQSAHTYTYMCTHTHMLMVTQTCATQQLTLRGAQTQGEPRERQSVCLCSFLPLRLLHESQGHNNKKIMLESGTEKQRYISTGT